VYRTGSFHRGRLHLAGPAFRTRYPLVIRERVFVGPRVYRHYPWGRLRRHHGPQRVRAAEAPRARSGTPAGKGVGWRVSPGSPPRLGRDPTTARRWDENNPRNFLLDREGPRANTD